jgi:hypothetical protein
MNDTPPSDWNSGDWLVQVARLILRGRPHCETWEQVVAFLRAVREQEGLEPPGEAFQLLRQLVRSHQGENPKCSAPEIAQVLYIHGCMAGASKAAMQEGAADGLTGW